jgi:medium-chain acyl-[acyl-carrier-protein] hydrolase
MPPQVWSEPFHVRSYEIAADGRLTLPHLCDWLQEAAGNHATALGVATDRLLEDGRAWVLTRLRVEVDRYPTWRETLILETWPSAADGLYAQRDFVLLDGGHQQVARATSQWLVIDVARRRPVRLPPSVLDLHLPDRPHALEPLRDALEAPEDSPHVRQFSVRRSDLDLNDHVNNVRYIEWALEAVPDSVTGSCRGLDVQFRAESIYGDTIETACSDPRSAGDTLALRHRVTRTADGTLLAVLATRWQPGE